MKGFGKGREYIILGMAGVGKENGARTFKMGKEYIKIKRAIWKKECGRWGRGLMRAAVRKRTRKSRMSKCRR